MAWRCISFQPSPTAAGTRQPRFAFSLSPQVPPLKIGPRPKSDPQKRKHLRIIFLLPSFPIMVWGREKLLLFASVESQPKKKTPTQVSWKSWFKRMRVQTKRNNIQHGFSGVPDKQGHSNFWKSIISWRCVQIVNLKFLLYWYPTITHFPKKSEFPYHPPFFRALCGAKEVVRAPASPRIRCLLSNAGANRTCIHRCPKNRPKCRCAPQLFVVINVFSLFFKWHLGYIRVLRHQLWSKTCPLSDLNRWIQCCSSFSISIVSCLVEKWLCSYDKFVHCFGNKLRKFGVLSQRNKCVTWAVLLSWGHESAMKNWELKFGPGFFFSDHL